MSVALDESYGLAHQGETPNYNDPYTRGPLLLALSGVAVGIMYLFLVVRFYAKLYILHKLTWDDCELNGNAKILKKIRSTSSYSLR